MAVVIAVMIVVMMRNIYLKAWDKCINRLVKYNEVDRDKSGTGGKLVKKSSKSRKIVKIPKKP